MYLNILFYLPLLLALITELRVKLAFNKYSKINNNCGLTGYEIAKKILRANKITNVEIEKSEGKLTDHFNPVDNIIKLSEEVYNGKSIAAISVAAHEVGHAIQREKKYMPYEFRATVFPAVSFSFHAAIPIFLAGLIFSKSLMLVGIILFFLIVIFQLATLPVEFNASKRALKELSNNDLLKDSEFCMASSMLHAAALTYVTSLIASIFQLLRLIIIACRKR